MWPLLVVILSPEVDLLLGIRQAQEPVFIQALLTKPSVERLDIRIARSTEVQLHAVEVSPPVQAPGNKLRAVVDSNRLGASSLLGHLLQGRDHMVAGTQQASAGGVALGAAL